MHEDVILLAILFGLWVALMICACILDAKQDRRDRAALKAAANNPMFDHEER